MEKRKALPLTRRVTRERKSMKEILTSPDLRAQTIKVLQTLTPREERVLRMRFGIGEPDYSPAEIEQRFAATRERIRQIEAKALRKLKHPSRWKNRLPE